MTKYCDARFVLSTLRTHCLTPGHTMNPTQNPRNNLRPTVQTPPMLTGLGRHLLEASRHLLLTRIRSLGRVAGLERSARTSLT